MRFVFFALLVLATGTAMYFGLTAPLIAPKHKIHETSAGDVSVEQVAGPFSHPWAMAFLPDGVMLVGGEFGNETRNVQFHHEDNFETWREFKQTKPKIGQVRVNKRVRSLDEWQEAATSSGLVTAGHKLKNDQASAMFVHATGHILGKRERYETEIPSFTDDGVAAATVTSARHRGVNGGLGWCIRWARGSGVSCRCRSIPSTCATRA